MTKDTLSPKLDLLRQEYVLVQAWKKTASYIRYHNWFSDTLELDRAAINLPRFLSSLMERLEAPDQWINDRLRIVPAPKSQRWKLTIGNNGQVWGPAEKGQGKAPLRPLAHVSLKDQVAATAVMLCIADRVETIQGDPRARVTDAETRRHLISYGNRLFCDEVDGDLRHRWGSAKLYRAFFQDYHSFLTRPEVVAKDANSLDGSRVVIVHSDLRQFYDRVRPELLIQKLSGLRASDEEADFFDFAAHLMNWEWDSKDTKEVGRYANNEGIQDFSKVALPQGLVASGFFANVVLLDFDQSLMELLSQEQDIEPGVRVLDACRYVDDLRIVVRVNRTMSLTDIEELVFSHVLQLLESHAPGLEPKREKTVAAVVSGEERPLVRQSRKMKRIQGAISGGFDAVGGEKIIDAVQGLIRSQQRYSEQRTERERWSLSPLPDVRDNTVARFAAARFRRTYRSLRPLLADQATTRYQEAAEDEDVTSRPSPARTRTELDDEARAFALGLIEHWVRDPSNARLLRIGLDIWPSPVVLKGVLGLLRPFTEKGGRRGAPRRVVWYCLSELLRAGATETGFVEEEESLPMGVDIDAYRSVLRDEAIRILLLSSQTLPWYLRQQALLFLAANDPGKAPIVRTGQNKETKHYRELIRFLRKENKVASGASFATLAVLSRRCFATTETAVDLVAEGITRARLDEIAERDPSFAIEILGSRPDLVTSLSPRRRDDLCLGACAESDGWVPLANEVLHGELNGLLRNELAILRFALRFLDVLPEQEVPEAITPGEVLLQIGDRKRGFSEKDGVKVVPSRVASGGSFYRPPPWCPRADRWRFQLGYLLRFILASRQDFTRTVRPAHWKEGMPTYRSAESHWYQRLYGFFNGHSAFGDDWLPITDWMENLLFALLRWPGCRTSGEMDVIVDQGISSTRDAVCRRLQALRPRRDQLSGVLMLPLRTPRPDASSSERPLRACVVQTVVPAIDDFKKAAASGDLTLSSRGFRRWHRNHLSAALAAVERMLALRKTHTGQRNRLDWLILPELAVHPRDVTTHLVPFARANKTIILAGLTYQELLLGRPLVNSAIWIIPVWTKAYGLQVVTRRQGKQHLSPEEEELNILSNIVQGFRPCQWLIGYDWSSSSQDQPLWLTAAVCYDATDLALAADLRHQSDIFAIPALNKDVTTFDNMARALHYHMFQRVVVANNGKYGGSNAYYPCGKAHERQIFHLHGQPQASIAFFDIDEIANFIKRKELAADPKSQWKSLPAGMGDEMRGDPS